MQELTDAFAMKSQMLLLDPRPKHASSVDMVETGFELSEASNTPVMLQLRIRACHVYGRCIARDNVRPTFGLADAMQNPVRDTNRIVLPPANFRSEEHTSELQSLMRISYAVFCLKKKNIHSYTYIQ